MTCSRCLGDKRRLIKEKYLFANEATLRCFEAHNFIKSYHSFNTLRQVTLNNFQRAALDNLHKQNIELLSNKTDRIVSENEIEKYFDSCKGGNTISELDQRIIEHIEENN